MSRPSLAYHAFRPLVAVFGAMALLTSGCDDPPSSNAESDPAEEQSGTSADAGTSTKEEGVRFRDESTAALFSKIRSRLKEIGGYGQHHPPERVDRYRRESWCTPSLPPVTCRTGGDVTGREMGWARATLSAVHSSAEADRARGFTYLYEDRRPRHGTKAGWGMRFWLSYRARRVAGNSLRITFFQFEESDLVEQIEVGGAYSYDIGNTSVRLLAPIGSSGADDRPEDLRRIEAELGRLLRSPEHLQRIAGSRLEALGTKVVRKLGSGAIKRCRPGDTGDCQPTPLDDEARSKWRKRVREDIERKRRLLERHAPAMHEVLTRAMPSDIWFDTVGDPR